MQNIDILLLSRPDILCLDRGIGEVLGAVDQAMIEHSAGRKTDRGEANPEYPGGMPPIHATIGDIVAGKKNARDSDSERIIGMAICEISLGHLTLARTREKGIGQSFRLS